MMKHAIGAVLCTALIIAILFPLFGNYIDLFTFLFGLFGLFTLFGMIFLVVTVILTAKRSNWAKNYEGKAHSPLDRLMVWMLPVLAGVVFGGYCFENSLEITDQQYLEYNNYKIEFLQIKDRKTLEQNNLADIFAAAEKDGKIQISELQQIKLALSDLKNSQIEYTHFTKTMQLSSAAERIKQQIAKPN